MDKIFRVYILRAENELLPFYVGKSYVGSTRISNHIYRSKQTKCFRDSKVNSLLSKGIKIIEEDVFLSHSEKEVLDKEKELIAFYGRRDKGLGVLTNQTDGGDAGPTGAIVSTETREKMSRSHVGLKAAGKNHPSLSKEISCYKQNGIFLCTYPSIEEAARQLQVKPPVISALLRDNRRQKAGYFLRVNDVLQFRYGASREKIEPATFNKSKSKYFRKGAEQFRSN